MFVSPDFWAVAFDSGGVTTGPMTVPFIMALGVGVSAVRSDKQAGGDSFGLVALCSIGPIITVLLLGLLYQPDGSAYTNTVMPDAKDTVEMFHAYVDALPEYFAETAKALAPHCRVSGAVPAGDPEAEAPHAAEHGGGPGLRVRGACCSSQASMWASCPWAASWAGSIAGHTYNWILIPIAMVIGYFIVQAEPAVPCAEQAGGGDHGGSHSRPGHEHALSVGVAVSLALAMIRVLTGISIMWFLIPGYAISLTLSFVVPEIFTSVAFDSGGVASGPMTATFLLPFALGACAAAGEIW